MKTILIGFMLLIAIAIPGLLAFRMFNTIFKGWDKSAVKKKAGAPGQPETSNQAGSLGNTQSVKSEIPDTD